MTTKRKIILTSGAVLSLVLLVGLGSLAYSEYQSYEWQKRTDALQEALIRPYREDTYGGKTPEETWAMFLDALRKKDVELASKYIELGKRIKLEKFLSDEVQAADYNAWLKNLTKVKEDKTQRTYSRAYYYYEYYSLKYKTSLSSSVVFFFNPYTKVWKVLDF